MKRIAIISPDATGIMLKNLKKLHLRPVKIPATPHAAAPIAGHPDIQLFIYKDRCYCNPDISLKFLREIENSIEIVICHTGLSPVHPGDIPYNIAVAGNYAFHKLQYTEKRIKQDLSGSGVKFIDVRQPYTKCSTLVADSSHIITSDKSVHTSASASGIHSLLIKPGHVRLPGYSYGFIGGASGNTEEKVILTGRLVNHPCHSEIVNFINKTGKEIYYLSKEDIVDLGSIFII